MRRVFTVLLLFIIILGCGYGIYYYWDKQKSIDTWSLVPETTLLVYENQNLVSTWNDLQENPIWADLLNIPAIEDLKNNFETLDSLAGKNGRLDNFIRNNRVLISMHLTAKDDFGFVFYQSLQNPEQVDLIQEIQEKLGKLKTTSRQYEDYQINELKNKENKVIFSYIILRGNFIGSYSPILIEDVIRNLSKEASNFKSENQDIFKIAKFQNDAGNFFINLKRLNKFVRLFLKDSQKEPFDHILESFSGSTFLDLIFDEHKLYYNGYTFANDSNAYLKLFDKQKGGAVAIKNYIPNRTAYLAHERFSDAKSWMESKTGFWDSSAVNFKLEREQYGQKFKSDFTNFHRFIQDEVGLAVLNSEESREESDKLLFIKLGDKNEGLNEFNKLAEEAVALKGDTLYYEFYANQEIRELAIEEFPKWLLGPNYAGFKHTYFMLMDDYIVLTNQIQSLKNLVQDIEDENVWGRTIKHNQFIEANLQDANLSLFVNLNQCWQMINGRLNEKWKAIFNENENTIRNLDQLAIQFSKEDGRYYTNLSIEHQPKKRLDKLSIFNALLTKEVNNEIISKPLVVKNYATGKFETIVQDSLFALSCIDETANLQWMHQLDAPIISDIYSVDFFKNNKIQYAFATAKKVYVLDRNGMDVAGSPYTYTTEEDIKFFSVVDYDKSKTYRFLVSTESGAIYLSDKHGDLLGDWKPLQLTDKLAAAPEHIRIRSKDFMVALQKNGLINVMSRNSQMKPNFPIDLSDRLTENLFFETGNDFDQSKIVTLTSEGKLVKASFNGEITQQNQLYKPTKETIFKIIPDASKRKYILARQDKNRVSILNAKGDLLFDKDYISQEEMAIQYYQFAADKEIVIITDKVQQFSYIYTLDGTLINSQPIESDHEVAAIYYSSENAIHIYKNHLNTFSIIKINL